LLGRSFARARVCTPLTSLADGRRLRLDLQLLAPLFRHAPPPTSTVRPRR